MAKNKPKTDNSRAARRAASPSLDVDKSLTTLPRAEPPTTQRHSILSDRRNSGIQKKQKQKKLTRAQRLRQQKGMDRAEAVLDRLEIKKAKSASRQKTVKERRGQWEELNQKSTMFAALQRDNTGDDDDDDDDDDAMAENTEQPKSKSNLNPVASANVASTQVANDPALVDEDDEIT
ncbi:hypothetical protein PENDEC_c009G06233 [Penicillium decumbens]|uniref:Ribosome biogenesis protein Alb1 n=1 Tax=Penicillium decumbens TaxID=69771 RepID=A0A1V6PDR6_PENDC|nr:hypothetical protein PENDEC_c009G06233 [Penicillium decumbens]